MSLADESLFNTGADVLFVPGRSFSWNLVSTRLTQFSYFNRQLGEPVWKGRKILDFGGNIGTFLASSGDNVDHDDYWCIDLNRAVVEEGRRTYPRAHFVHYDRYNSQYNPGGSWNVPIPDCGIKFDIILAFSVFTHVDRSEMVQLVESLLSTLAPRGVLAFTFFEPHYDRSLSDPCLPVGSSAVTVQFVPRGADGAIGPAQWYVLIDDCLYVEPGDELSHQARKGKALESYTSYFTEEFMVSLFPGAVVLPPVSPEWQHCCTLRKTGVED
jgi:SAM-dependent methyltransferase